MSLDLSLISEFVTINNGKYIVRVIIVKGGETIATGLAGGETVELAEDNARKRAITFLQENINFSASNPLLSQTMPINSPRTSSTSSKSVKSDVNIPTNSNLLPLESLDKFTSTSPSDSDNHNYQLKEAKKEEKINTSEESNEIDDNSNWDIITRTDIQLKRLSWTKEQGKNYLLQTYGKKSRHTLTDEELQEFCLYLESQPY